MKYITVEGDTAIIAVPGRYTLVQTLEVGQELKTALTDLACKKVIVDFGSTTFIDSSVDRQFIKVRRQIGAENFKVVHATGAVRQALHNAKLDAWIQG